MVARRIIGAVAESLQLEAHEVVTTSSIGITVFPQDARSADELLRNSDIALQHAKQNGKNGFTFFDAAMNAAALRRMALEMALRAALEKNELQLHYQPQIDLHSNRIIADAFRMAHRNFLKKTVHAGEAYGPESIFEAITRLNADRIGHGTHLYAVDQVEDDDAHRYVRQLSEYIADRRVLIEVCVTSNMQTMPELRRVQDHPLARMIQDRLSVTLCTDNRLVSRTTVTDEVQKVTEAFHLTAPELRNTLLHGFKRSFFPGSYKEKRAYVRKVIDFYDRVSKEHGHPTVARGEDR